MDQEKKELILKFIGIIFLVFAILAIIETAIINKTPDRILWFCYAYLFITGISILMRNSKFLISQLNIMLFPLIFWNIDFYLYHLTGQSIIGLSHYYILPGRFISKVVVIQHLFSWILSLIALYLIKINKIQKNSWKFSFIYVFILFFLSLIFSTEANNVNCVLRSCFNFDLPFYYFSWFFILFTIIMVTNWIITKIKIFNK